MQTLMDYLQPVLQWGLHGFLHWILPALVTLFVIALALWVLRRSFPDRASTRLYRQIGQVLVFVLGNIALVLVLPFEAETRGQLLSLFGLVITAVIALSSTTFVSNAMAGLMLRAVNSFRAGDFIRVDTYFGRVTEKGLLHSEIQTEDRDLVTLPNLFVMTHPVRVVRTSGTLVSCEVSLGYDVYRRRVSELLKRAATDAELDEPFVRITELGNFSVSYRVSGFLKQVDTLVSKRTELRAKVLDRLHGSGIEIVSPSYMNQRQINPERRVIPTQEVMGKEVITEQPEDLMFDKAEMAARLQKFQQQRDKLEEELENLEKQVTKAEEPEQRRIALEIDWRKRQIASLDEILQQQDVEL